jgi:glycine cleavage system H protein
VTHYYKRSRFSTRLPKNLRYTAAHYWMGEEEPGIWRVGLTKFATRMLGDLVECEVSAPLGAEVQPGQVVGWVEGLKAVSDVYCVMAGEFLGSNPELAIDISLADTDMYGRGWLYKVGGRPEADSLDVDGYVAVLDATIDKMIESRYDSGGKNA